MDLTSQAVGAGPFVLESWVRDDRMVLRANPDWKGSAGPYVDTLTWRVIPDEEQKVDTFVTGDADGIYSSVPGGIARALASVDGADATAVPVTTGSVISFNASAPPFDDLAIRTAFRQAVDWQTAAESILGENAIAPDNFTIEGTPWYSPEATLPSYDVEAAQAAIDEYVAATGGPVSFQFLTGQGSTGVAIAEYVQTAMSQLDGVEVTVETQDTPSFITAVRNGDYQVTVWGNPMPEPEPGLSLLVRTGSVSNFSHFSNPDIDVLIDEQRVVADPDVRLPLLRDIFAMLAHDLPYFPYMVSEYTFVVNPDVHGIVLHEDGILRGDLVWKA